MTPDKAAFPVPRRGFAHDFHCTHNPCRCRNPLWRAARMVRRLRWRPDEVWKIKSSEQDNTESPVSS